MEYTKEQLFQKYLAIPDDVKDAMDSIELIDTLDDITSKYKLHIDQRGKLANEVGLFLLGATRSTDFLSHIQTCTGLPVETAGEIVKELNTKIFFPIRESLEKINNGGAASYRPEQATKVENFSPAGNVSRGNIQKNEGPLPTPGNNAIIVGNVSPHNDDSGDKKLFDEKMGKLFRLPKEELELGSTNTDLPGDGDPKKTADPYHEAID